jgi:hypothetical protein
MDQEYNSGTLEQSRVLLDTSDDIEHFSVCID